MSIKILSISVQIAVKLIQIEKPYVINRQTPINFVLVEQQHHEDRRHS